MTPQCGLPITPELHYLPWPYTVALLALAGLFAVGTCWAVLHRDDVPTNPDPFSRWRLP